MPYVVLCRTGWYTLQKWKKSFHTHDIASYTAKRHQLVCWQTSISVNWAVGGVCKVFACLLGSKLSSFGTELLIAALSLLCLPFSDAYSPLHASITPTALNFRMNNLP